MEENKAILYGEHIFKILRLITKLGLKQEILKSFKTIMKLDSKRKSLNARIVMLLDNKEYTNENVQKVLFENEELAVAIGENQASQSEEIFNIVMLVCERIPQAQNEVCELLASIYEKSEEEILAKVRGFELIEMIKGVIKSEDFQKVFTNIFK